MREAVIVSTARTPIGKAYRGAFNDTQAQTLGGHAIANALNRASVDPGEIDDVVMGAAMQQGAQGGNVARQALLRAGLPTSVAGMSLDRQCASGLMAIATAAKEIIDDGMSEDLKITVIATGFAGREVRRIDRADATRLSKGQGGPGLADVRTDPLPARHAGAAARTPELQRTTPAPGGAGRASPSPARATPLPAQPRGAGERPVRHLSLDEVRKITGIDEDELDIPTFLRHGE